MKIYYFWSFLFLSTVCLPAGQRQHGPREFKGLKPIEKSQRIPSAEGDSPSKKTKLTFSTMNYKELLQAKEESKKSKNWTATIKYLDRMIIMCDNEGKDYLQKKALHLIELADILFDQQRYDEAAKRYTEFTTAHPGDKHLEYASYKAIVCASKKILSIDRDQSATEKTLELADAFLKRTIFTTYKKEVEQIQQTCYQTLAQSDCNVAEFYLKYGNYQAAEQRLKSVRTQWIDKAPQITTKLATLEVELSTVSPQFKAPEASFKVAELKSPVKKVDMATRF